MKKMKTCRLFYLNPLSSWPYGIEYFWLLATGYWLLAASRKQPVANSLQFLTAATLSSAISLAQAGLLYGEPAFPMQPENPGLEGSAYWSVPLTAIGLLHSLTSTQSNKFHPGSLDAENKKSYPLLPSTPLLATPDSGNFLADNLLIADDPAFIALSSDRPVVFSLCSAYPVEYHLPDYDQKIEIASQEVMETDDGSLYCSRIKSQAPITNTLLSASPYPELKSRFSTLGFLDNQGQEKVINLSALNAYQLPTMKQPDFPPSGINLSLNPVIWPEFPGELPAHEILLLSTASYPVREVPWYGNSGSGQSSGMAGANRSPSLHSAFARMTMSSGTGAGGIGAGGGGGGDDRPPNEQGQMVDLQGARLDLNSIVTTQQITSVDTQYETPLTMFNLHQFDVPTQVGPNYMTFGVFLLDDPTSMTIINSYARGHSITETVRKILTRWLSTGTRTWEQLIQALRIAELNALADDLERKLMRKPFSTRTGWASPHMRSEFHCSSETPPSYLQATSQDGAAMAEADTPLNMLMIHRSPCIPCMKICYKELFTLLGLSQDQISEIVRDNPTNAQNSVHDGFHLLWKIGYRFTWRSIWELLANGQTPGITQLRREIEQYYLNN